TTYCLSALILYHNTEARMYCLFVLTCSIGLFIYVRIAQHVGTPPAYLGLNLLCHGAIVLTNLYGVLYSGAFLLSSVVADWTSRRRMRWGVCGSVLGGWAFLVPFVPGLIRQSHNYARWFQKVELNTFAHYYLSGTHLLRYI